MPNTREKLVELLTDRIPGIDNELRYVDDERVERLADHLIANGVTLRDHDCHWATEIAYKNGYEAGKPKWIPVTERLPEINKQVLCFDSHNRIFMGGYLGANYKKGVACFRDTAVGFGRGTTHWMPLPEPPKEE